MSTILDCPTITLPPEMVEEVEQLSIARTNAKDPKYCINTKFSPHHTELETMIIGTGLEFAYARFLKVEPDRSVTKWVGVKKHDLEFRKWFQEVKSFAVPHRDTILPRLSDFRDSHMLLSGHQTSEADFVLWGYIWKETFIEINTFSDKYGKKYGPRHWVPFEPLIRIYDIWDLPERPDDPEEAKALIKQLAGGCTLK